MASVNGGSGTAPGRSRDLGVGVEQLEDALGGRHRLLQVGVDARQLLDRPVHQQQRGDERRELARPSAGPARFPGCRTTARRRWRRRPGTPSAAAAATARAVTFRLVRNSVDEARSNFARLAALGAEGLDDAVAGERFAGDVRHVLLRLLAPARHGAHALAEAHQRIDDQRRRGHAHQRELGVVVEQQRRPQPTSVSDSRARSPIVSDTARCTRPTSLLMRDSNWPVVRRAKNAAD